MIENIETAISAFWGWIVAAVMGGAVWVVRRVFTNQKQIEMLQREIQVRDERRIADKETVSEIKADVAETRQDVKDIHTLLLTKVAK